MSGSKVIAIRREPVASSAADGCTSAEEPAAAPHYLDSASLALDERWDSRSRPAGEEPPLWLRNKQLAQQAFATGETALVSRPLWITFDTASVCNLRCVQCPRENPLQSFQEETAAQAVVDRVVESAPFLQRLSLHGLGEPLLSDNFWRLIESPRTAGISNVDVNTNGTLLTDANIERLLNSNLKTLRISMDGATAETYMRIRQASFDKVTDGIRRLTARRRELGRQARLEIWVQMTLMVENIRELPGMVDLCCELGVDTLWAHQMNLRSDNSQDAWIIHRKGWVFDYKKQTCRPSQA